jgi:hypothetical protein
LQTALDDGFPVELGQGGEEAEQWPAHRGGGVDALFQRDEVDAALVEPGRQAGQVLVAAPDAPRCRLFRFQ